MTSFLPLSTFDRSFLENELRTTESTEDFQNGNDVGQLKNRPTWGITDTDNWGKIFKVPFKCLIYSLSIYIDGITPVWIESLYMRNKKKNVDPKCLWLQSYAF